VLVGVLVGLLVLVLVFVLVLVLVLVLVFALVLALLDETPRNDNAAKDNVMTNSRYMFIFICSLQVP